MAAARSRQHFTTSTEATLENSMLRRFLPLIVGLNVISAMLFISIVHRPVFDETLLMQDVDRYAHQGISVETIRQNVNAPGPSGFAWMATFIRLMKGDELTDARYATLATWLFLSCSLLLGARLSRTPGHWHYALLATLTFPHTMTASATVLTEGPALSIAVVGALLWIESISAPVIRRRTIFTCLTGGTLMGLAITVRQYYAAVLPAMFFFGIYCIAYTKQPNATSIISAISACIEVIADPWPLGNFGVGVTVRHCMKNVEIVLLDARIVAMLSPPDTCGNFGHAQHRGNSDETHHGHYDVLPSRYLSWSQVGDISIGETDSGMFWRIWKRF